MNAAFPSRGAVPVTVVVLAKNEASIIERCLASLQWCGEMVVIDDNSTDDTASRSESLGARVLQHSFQSFADQRNWALNHGRLEHEWVLMFDADELASPQFALSVAASTRQPHRDTAAFKTCRKTMLHGKWLKYSDGFPVWIMRIVRQGRAQFVDAAHGEVPVPHVDGRVDQISEPFEHYPYCKGIQQWLERHIEYARKEATSELTQDKSSAPWDLLSRHRERRRQELRRLSKKLPARPLLRFCYQYFLKRGFLDGSAGLTFCRLMACYESMILAHRSELQAQSHEQQLKIPHTPSRDYRAPSDSKDSASSKA